METLTEISRDEQARRVRARRYEQLKGNQQSLRGRIKNLEAAMVDLTPLEKIADLANTLPKEIYTIGHGQLGSIVSGGLVVRDVIKGVVASGLADGARRNEERKRDLKTLREQLKKVETELEEFA